MSQALAILNQQDHKEHVGIALAGLAEYYQHELSPAMFAVYYNSLKAYSIEQIDRAVDFIVRSSKFMPKIADFVQAIEGIPQDRGSAAWQRLLDLLETTGAYQSVESYDLAWSIALDRVFGSWLGSLEKLRNCSREIEAHHRNAFLRAYEAAERDLGPKWVVTTPRHHAGLHEAHNSTCGGDKSRLAGVVFKQQVYVLTADGYRAERREYSAVTGRELTAADRLALTQGAGLYSDGIVQSLGAEGGEP